MGRATNHSFRNSFDSNHQANTPRELVTFVNRTQQNKTLSRYKIFVCSSSVRRHEIVKIVL